MWSDTSLTIVIRCSFKFAFMIKQYVLLRLAFISNVSTTIYFTLITIPFGLCIRARRVWSSDKGYFKQREKIKTNLRKCGYSKKEIQNQLVKVDKLNRSDLLNYKNVFRYSSALYQIFIKFKKKTSKTSWKFIPTETCFSKYTYSGIQRRQKLERLISSWKM